jgi:hypothetical protein
MDSTERLRPQSPALFPYHRDLRRNGDFFGGRNAAVADRPRSSASGGSPPNSGPAWLEAVA